MITHVGWTRNLLLAGAACLVTAAASPAFGGNHHGARNVYIAPTEYVAVAPTAYVVPSSYVVPTSFAITPTSYVLDRSYAYVSPTVYTTGVMVPARRRLVSRPVYGMTTYVVPTSYDLPLSTFATTVMYPTNPQFVETSAYSVDPCCATMSSRPQEMSSSAIPAKGAAGNPAETSARKRTPTTLNSEPAGGNTTTRDTASPPATAAAGSADPGDPTPPVAPAPEKNPAENVLPNLPPTPITPAEKDPLPPAEKPLPPLAPGGDAAGPAEEADTLRRQVQKPVFSMTPKALLRSASKANLNLLGGKVVSGDSGAPESGVRITASSRLQGVPDVSVTTDASGRYAVRLADGDWTVKVTMPSGRTYAVSQLNVTDGQIVDDAGRPIPSLTITR